MRSINPPLTSGWNMCNLAGIIALYTATAAHFVSSTVVLERVGAVGVLANSFSFLEFLQLYENTGTILPVELLVLYISKQNGTGILV